MRQQSIATGFTKYTLAGLSEKSTIIYNAMLTNEKYTEPPVTMKALLAFIVAFDGTRTAQPSKTNTAQKKVNRTALIGALKKIAAYILSVGGDVASYATTGFDLTKVPQPVGILSKPVSFSVTPFYEGGMILALNKLYGADSYSFEYKLIGGDQDNPWVSVSFTKTKLTLSNLKSGSQYAFRVAGVGSNPARIYSDVIISYVLLNS